MPFVPSHKRTRFKANKVFTDRDEPRTRFLRAFDPPPGAEQYRVLVFYGVGGEGKTALARHLLGMLEKEYAGRAGWAAVNFEDAAMRRPAEGLLSVRLQLRRTAGLAFPAFDTAFAHWFGKTYPGADIRQRHPELFRSTSEDAKDTLDILPDLGALLTDALDEVPGLGFIYKNLHRIHNRYRKWMEEKGRKLLAGIESLQPDQLLDRLPSFLGADIADAIAAIPARRPLAIVGDTTEAFHRAEGQKAGAFAFRNDRWLRDLVKEAPGVLFVLLGRDRLRWAEVEPEWAEVLDQHRLGALSAEDAEKFLLDVPVEEPAIRARMVEGAKGLPFYLDLQVDLYERLKNQGQEPEPEQFGGSEPEILDRFLDHLGEAVTRALAVLAHCQRFDEALWLHLGREFMGGLPPLAFSRLRGFSFVEELAGGYLSLHASMREELCERTGEGEPVLYERVQQCLFTWWDERCQPADVRSITPAHELALEEAAYHRAGFEPETFGDWALERGVALLYEAGRYGLVQKLWETALAIEEGVLPKDHPKVGRTRGNVGVAFWRNGDLDAALIYLRSSLIINEHAFSPDHPEIATALLNIGDVLQAMGKYDDAIMYLERALPIRERAFGPNHPEVGIAHNDLGQVLLRKGDPDRALIHLQSALAINEQALGPNHYLVAYSLLNIGNALQAKGDYISAITHLERALTIRRLALSRGHPEIGAALNDLGHALWRNGELDAASARLEEARAIYERALGPENFLLANPLQNLGCVLCDKNELDQAQGYFVRVLEMRERALGPDHPDVALTLLNLTLIDGWQGNSSTARRHCIRALTILRTHLGEGHAYAEQASQLLKAINVADGPFNSPAHP